MNLLLEVRKLRRKRLPLLLGGLFGLEGMWLIFTFIGRDRLSYALAEAIDMFVMLFPLVVGLVAVQIVGVDQEERMGQLMAARGRSPVRRFLDKLVLADLIVIVFHVLQIGLVLLVAGPLGLQVTQAAADLIGPMMAATVFGCVAVTAAQLALAQVCRPAGVSVVAGLIAGLIAMALPFLGIAPAGWLFPWGLLAAASPVVPLTVANRANPEIVLSSHMGLSLTAAGLMAVVWTLVAVYAVVREEQRR